MRNKQDCGACCVGGDCPPVVCGACCFAGTVPSCFVVLDAAGSRVSLGLGDKRGTSVRGSIGMFCDYFDIILA